MTISMPAPRPADPTQQQRRPCVPRLPLMLAAMALVPWLANPAGAHRRGLYATQAEAQKRAAELHCTGTFALGNQWMPCANERALHEALQKAP